MSEQTMENMNGGRSFEVRVFARFDMLDASISDLNGRVERLEARSYDTKPIWEQALKEITETRQELTGTRQELSEARLEIRETRQELRDVSKRLDRMIAIVHDNRADIREAEERIEKIEAKLQD